MVLQENLFGEIQDSDKERPTMGAYNRFRRKHHYRKAAGKERRCATCKYSVRVQGNTRNYAKCRLQGISASFSSDIRWNHVCDQFEADPITQ